MTVHLEIVGCTTCPFCSHLGSFWYCFGKGRSVSYMIGDAEDLDHYTNKTPNFCPLQDGPTTVKLDKCLTLVEVKITPPVIEDDDVLI